MTSDPTIIRVNTNWDYIADPNAVTLRQAIAQTQLADSNTEYHIIFEKDPDVKQDPNSPKDLNVGHFVIRLLAPLPNIYRNKVTINPGTSSVNSVILMPYFAGKSRAKDYLSKWRDKIDPRKALGIGVPSSSILHVGDVNLVHDNYRSKAYTTGNGLPKVSLNSINFVKNIAKGGDGERGAGGGVGVGGAITMTTGDLTINNAVFQDLEARGGIGAIPAKGAVVVPQGIRNHKGTGDLSKNSSTMKCYRAMGGKTDSRSKTVGYWNATWTAAERGGTATSPSVPIRNGNAAGGSSGLDYVKLYNPNGSEPGKSGSTIRYDYRKKDFEDLICTPKFEGWRDYTTRTGTRGETPPGTPTTFSGIYGGGGAGGSGGGAPGLRPPQWITSGLNKTSKAGENPNTWFSVKGNGGAGGSTTHGGGSGGKGNNGYAHTSNPPQPKYSGGTKGQDGEGRGGAIAILNRGTNTRLTLNNVKFINNKANGRESKGHSIYSENLDTTASSNIYVKDVKYKDGDDETKLDESNLNDASNSQFFNSPLSQLVEDNQSWPSTYSYGVSSPRSELIADLTDMTLKGNEKIADIFTVNFDSSDSIVGISTNFNHPNNPFRQIWKKIEITNANSKLRTAQLESEIQAQLLSQSDTPNFEKVAFLSTFMATFGEACKLGPTAVHRIGCQATNIGNTAILSAQTSKEKDNIDAINGVQQTESENAKSLESLITWLDSPETSGVEIATIDKGDDRSVVFIDDFELGKDMIQIPIAKKMDGNEYVIEPKRFNDGTDGRNEHQVTFTFTNDTNHFLRVRLSEKSYQNIQSFLKPLGAYEIDDFFHQLLHKKTKTKTLGGKTQPSKYWEISDTPSMERFLALRDSNYGTPFADYYQVDRSETKLRNVNVTSYGGQDLLIGTNENEEFSSGSGNDIIQPLLGQDTIDGGDDIDSLLMAAVAIPLNIDVNANNTSELVATLPGDFKFSDPDASAVTVNTSIENVENFEFWAGSNIDLSGYQPNSSDAGLNDLIVTTGTGSTITGWDGDDNITISLDETYNDLNNDPLDAITTIDGGSGANTLRLPSNYSQLSIEYCSSTRKITITNNSGKQILQALNIDHLNLVGSDKKETHYPATTCNPPNERRVLERKDSQSIGSIVYDLGGGDDHYDLRVGDQTIHGGRGNDTLKGFSNSDILIGNSGKDYLVAKGRHDLLVGGQGDDTLISKGKNNYMIGGSGEDHYHLKKSGSNTVIITTGSGFVDGFNPQRDHLAFANINSKPDLTPAKSKKHLSKLIAEGEDNLIAYENKILYKNKRAHDKYKEIEFTSSLNPLIEDAIYTRLNIGDILDDQLNAEWIDHLGFNPYAS